MTRSTERRTRVGLSQILYVDATISPFGTALVFTSGTSRLVVAMSRNRNIPKFFGRIARSGLPVRALFANWIVGMILLAPLPGWDLLAGIVSATTMLTAAVASLADCSWTPPRHFESDTVTGYSRVHDRISLGRTHFKTSETTHAWWFVSVKFS